MANVKHCKECGADYSYEQSCIDHFHLLGIWELDYQLYDVHHLMVLCYHLQHPSLYSPEALAGAMTMLAEFVEDGVTPQMMRKNIKSRVDSGNRTYKIKGIPASFGQYEKPVSWKMSVSDVVQAGSENYYDSVRQWAESTLKSLRDSGNLV